MKDFIKAWALEDPLRCTDLDMYQKSAFTLCCYIPECFSIPGDDHGSCGHIQILEAGVSCQLLGLGPQLVRTHNEHREICLGSLSNLSHEGCQVSSRNLHTPHSGLLSEDVM